MLCSYLTRQKISRYCTVE